MKRSRLFGAWSASLGSRSISLIPIVGLLFAGQVVETIEVRMYIASFAYIAASSYILNFVTEGTRFTSRKGLVRTKAGDATWVGLSIFGWLLFAIPYLTGPLPIQAGLVGAVALQAAIARWRIRTIDSPRFRSGYVSTAVRDAPAATITILGLLFNTRLMVGLPLGLAVGAGLQYAFLRHRASLYGDRLADVQLAMTRASSPASPQVLLALSAVCLAAFQPLMRTLAEIAEGPDSLFNFELADRPAYILALVLAGGVGTELQRRWREMSTQAALRELFLAVLSVVPVMAVGLLAAQFGFRVVEGLRPGTLPSTLGALLTGTFIANGLYLWSVATSRALVSRGCYAANLVGFGLGLSTFLIAWCVLEAAVALEPTLRVPASAGLGFAVAFVTHLVFGIIRQGRWNETH